MKDHKKRKAFVRICPRCKSPDVDRDNSNPLTSSMGLPDMFVCNKCGFSGYTFPEVELDELEDFEEEVSKAGMGKSGTNKEKKTLLVDTSYGKFGVNVLWKISSVITIFGAILLLANNAAITGLGLLSAGLFMFYFAYLKK